MESITSINSTDLVFKYFRTLEERGLGEWVDRAFPTAAVFRLIEEAAGATAEEVVERLVDVVVPNIHPEAAGEVVGHRGEEAVLVVARAVALWYLQVAEELGVVRARRR